jgi:5-methylcytosine-specific restriction endonuclease McrA
MPRIEFSNATKLAAWKRAAGHCERCGALLMGKFSYEYDHDKPCAFDGQGTVENCRVLCRPCHGRKTASEDVPAIAKSNRIRRETAHIRRTRKITAWRNFSGEVVRKPKERD